MYFKTSLFFLTVMIFCLGDDILTGQKSAETKQGNKNKKNITHFTSHDVNFRCRCPAHSQAFSGPLYIGQNGKRLQTSTAPSTDYAFEVPYFGTGDFFEERNETHLCVILT